jgi:undecaprenyl-diphosphatase
MKSSWSTNIFLRINALQGRSRTVDRWFFFCANYLIYILGLLTAVWATYEFIPERMAALEYFLFFILIAIAVALSLSWWIGWMWPHRRPIIEHPRIKQMFHPMSTWKSFPSDHTIASFILVEALIVFGAPLWVSGPAFVFACTIGGSRIYAGVHYPRDILGGVLFASGASLLAFVILF